MKVKSKLLYSEIARSPSKISPPFFSPQEQDKRNREIERRLFDVFRKYAGRG